VQLDDLLTLSRATRANAAEVCLEAQIHVAAARATRRKLARRRATLPALQRRKRRVVVYLPDPVELERVRRQLADLDCEIFATTDLTQAAAEIGSDRAIDLLVTAETLAQLEQPAFLH